MRVALVGGSGFIGTHLVETYGAEVDFTVLDIQKPGAADVEYVACDVRDVESLKQALRGFDAVVLLAAEHKDNVSPTSLYYDVNVGGMKNVLEAMAENNIDRIIFTSSVAVYGMNHAAPPTEESEPRPFNHYGKSKLEAERVLESWCDNVPKLNAVVIRPTVVFGERNRGNVYNLVRQIKSGRFLMVGNGKNKKSMSYVGNVVAFIHYALNQSWSGREVFNYIDKPDLSMNELTRIIFEQIGTKPPPFRLPYLAGLAGGYALDLLSSVLRKELPLSSIRVKKFCASTVFSAEKAKIHGFEAPYELEEAIARTMRFESGPGAGL